MTRAYHNLTAHYNVYFNGKESLKAGVEKINNSVEDDYTKILPIFKSSDPGTAQAAVSDMEYAVQKGSKLIKFHSITKNPKRRKNRTEAYKKMAAREEYNNWVDDAYLLMGQAYFYMHNFNAAIDNFAYVTRKFNQEEIKYDAYIWLIRSYTMLERYMEASEVIQAMSGNEEFPKRLEGDLALVTANYHMTQLEFEEAIPFLSIAIKKTPSKKSKLRFKYILAQLYEETGDMAKASHTYREVASMNPPYKMAFNARINAAEAFSGSGNAEKLKKELRKMLRDRKNLEFRDQIYYALANIYKNEGNSDVSKDLYIKSASASYMNMYQRALSCLTLADLYFEEPDYLKSKAYYDSAMVVIDEKYPKFNSIKERHTNLTRLVDNIFTVQKEDSLQRIASLSETERNAMIDEWIRKAREEEDRLKNEAQSQTQKQGYYRMNQTGVGLGRQQEGAGWYFYSPTTVAYGRVEFKQVWGNRKLEDGWRRSNKLSRSEMDAEELAEEQKTDTIDNVIRVIDPKERSYYTQDLPLNDSLMVISHLRIRDALYNAGRIFKTVYNNFPRAIDSYLDLNKRYPGNIYELSVLFELWDLHNKSGDLANAETYKSRIIALFPESNYAKYLQNPNYFIELEARNDSLNSMYRQAFLSYRQGKYAEAGTIAKQMTGMEPDSALVPKIDFLQMVAQGTSSSREQFGTLLKNFIQKYPKIDPTPLAEKILTLIQDSTLSDYQKLIESGYLSEQIQNEELKDKKQGVNDEFGGKFSYDEELLHYFVIAYPNDAEIDINRLKFDIANYNIDHYTKIDFDIETETIGNTRLVIVRALDNKENGLIYFRSIIRKRDVFQALANVKYVNFVVSSTNYREIVADKNYNEYLKFFIKNYSRFISGDFRDDVLPSPEELMAKAKIEEEKPEERGNFVMVNTGRKSRLFAVEPDAPQNFAIAISDQSISLRQILSDFSNFNRKNFKDKSLKISQQTTEGYRIVVIGTFANKAEALQYFTQVVTTRSLFASLGTMSYRNFLISEGNLPKLISTGNMDNYMSFFSDVYLKGLTNTGENLPEAQQNVAAAQPAPDKTVQTTPNQQKQEQKPALPSYQGPFSTVFTGAHQFSLLIPKTGLNVESLLSAIRKFNTNYSASSKLIIQQTDYSESQQLVQIKGFVNDREALNYLQSVVQSTEIFGPLEQIDYRNFVISEENLKTLLQDKNLSEYLQFYKQYYLSRL